VTKKLNILEKTKIDNSNQTYMRWNYNL